MCAVVYLNIQELSGPEHVGPVLLIYKSTSSYPYTECVSESGDFATLFFLVRQHWGGCRYRHFAANFKAF